METKRQAIKSYTKKSPNPFRDFVRAQRIKRSKPLLAVLLLAGIWYLLIGKDILPDFMQNLQLASERSEAEKLFYEAPCSEANVARMLALSCGYELPEEGTEDAGETLWYEKYYRALSKAGMKALEEKNAFQVITYEKLQQAFSENFSTSISSMVLQQKESYEIYEVLGYLKEALDKSGKGKVSITEGAVLASPDDELPLKAWEVLTPQGTMNFEGLVIAPLKNKTVIFYTCGNQILGITEIKGQRCEVKQCKVICIEDEKVTYDTEGYQFTYKNKILTQQQVGGVFDLTLEADTIVDFKACTYEKVDTLLKVTDDKITLENAGDWDYDNVTVSDATDLNRFHSIADMVYGTKVGYITEHGKITALQVVSSSTQQAIRVVLTDEKGNHEQKQVKLTGSSAYDLLYKGEASDFEAGEVWNSSKSKIKEGESIRLVPREDSLMTLSSVVKGKESPSYKGIMEVTRTDKGFVVINEVNLEDYVAGVIPSEMPMSYGKEALKAQAVAARTFGAASMINSKFLDYGAHVDDTSASQVYNRIHATEASYEAARETAGLVLKSEGKLIPNKFFSTSCGYTANYGDTWAGATPPYLKAEKQYEDQLDITNLSDESQFEKFISLGPDDLDAYDEESPWFRWKGVAKRDILEKLILPNLKALSEEQNSPITYEDDRGKSVEKIEDIGSIKSLEVRKRGEGGNIITLAIIGTKGTALIHSEYAIRSLFASNDKVSLDITRQDGSEVTDILLLPSAFFIIDQEIDDETGLLTTLTLHGGGNGHGVGLSQDGAKGMAEKGYDFKKILSHFYPGTELVELGK